MDQVSRYGKFTALPGKGERVAELLVGAADELGANPGCLLYLVNRQADAPDTVWVTELWRSRAELDEVLVRLRESSAVAEVMPLVDKAEMIELDLVGGKGI